MDQDVAALAAVVDQIAEDVAHLRASLDEYLPLIRAYLDPSAGGPRGWYMRKQLAKGNGHA